MEKYKIILDTDIGDDIDDALALALALEMPEIELLGVTTVFLDTQKRARIAKKMLHLWGKEVPVYAGIRRGERTNPKVDAVPCQYTYDLEGGAYEALNDVSGDDGAAAVDFLVESAAKYGKELTVVAIGPLSNVAAAIRKAPEVMKGIDRIVLMGGCFYGDRAEWNILCDPLGAEIVFRSEVKIVCVGLDVTEQTQLSDRQQERIQSGGYDEKRDYLSSLVRLHKKSVGHNAFLHDPLTVYYMVHPDIMTLEDIRVRVETEKEDEKGRTINVEREKGGESDGKLLRVGKTVQAQRFTDEFLRLVFPEKG